MILDKIYSKLKFKRIVVFLVKIESKETISFTRYTILFKKGEASVEEQSETVTQSAESLFTGLDKDVPAFIYVLGRGIVHRMFNNENIAEQSIEDLYPNFNSDLNYFVRTDISESQTSIALVRKTQIQEDILGHYFKGVNIMGFVFGLSPVITLLDYFDFEKSDVVIEGVWFQKTETSYYAAKSEPVEQDIIFMNKEYSLNTVLAISASIYFYLKLSPESLLDTTMVHAVTSSWVMKRVLPIFLGFFLIVVVANYMLFASYSEKYNTSSGMIQQGQQTLKRLDELSLKIQENEKFIKDNNILYNADYSPLLDKIASIASRKVRFTRFQIHPLQKEIRNGREAKFGRQLITIEGETSKVGNYRTFLKLVDQIEWVTTIKRQSYRYDDKNKIGKFTVEVEYELKMES